jgi:ADP-heptose:LPS heptosyltransferase
MALLFLPNGLGDVLMAMPALKRLVVRYGDGNVSVVVAGESQSKILYDIFGNNLKIYCRYDGRRFSQLRLLWKMFIERGVIYAPMISKNIFNFIFFALTFRVVIVPWQVGLKSLVFFRFAKYSLSSFPGHQVNYLLSFVENDSDWVTVPEVMSDEMAIFDKKMHTPLDLPVKVAVGLSCGLRERHKIPKPRLFAKTINELSNNRIIEVFIFGVDSDRDLIKEFRAALSANVVVVEAINLPLIEIVKKLSLCDVGLVGTTGQGHMMAAAGLPLVVFSGVTNAYESGPYVERALIVSHSYPCGPCYQEAYLTGCGKIPCMDQLDYILAAKYLADIIDDSKSGINWRDMFKKPFPVQVSRIEDILRKNFR